MDHLLKLLKSNPLSSILSVSLAQTCINSNALSCSNSAPWIIDSRASNHMTSFSNLFSSYSPCSSSEKICIVNGSFSPIVGKGLIKISKNIILKSILHVTKLACNLLSMSKLSKDVNCHVTFFESHCEFQDQSSRRRIANARMIEGVYYFDELSSSNKKAQGF